MTTYRPLAFMGAAVLLTISVAVPAAAQPVRWSGNGHRYERVDDDTLTWEQARQAAVARGGYLVTITSKEENEFLSTTWGSSLLSHWTGGLQPPGSPEPGGGWTWVTGEAFVYSNWDGGEPNNDGGAENRIELSSNTTGDGNAWNDVPDDVTRDGYVIEWDEASVPLLGTWGIGALLALIAAAGLITLRQYRG